MGITHLLALIPLLIFLVLSLVFYGKALIHLITIGYAGSLAYIAISNEWEALFWTPIVGSIAIALILLWVAFVRGNWI